MKGGTWVMFWYRSKSSVTEPLIQVIKSAGGEQSAGVQLAEDQPLLCDEICQYCISFTKTACS